MQIRVCRYKNVGVAGYAEAFMPVQSDLQTSEWYSYFENDVLVFQISRIVRRMQQLVCIFYAFFRWRVDAFELVWNS